MHERTKREQKGRLESGRDANIENHENRFADIEAREGSGWGELTWSRGGEKPHPGEPEEAR